MRVALIMHEPLGEAFMACATHVLGYRPDAHVADIAPNVSVDQKVAQLIQVLEQNTEPLLILCDAYGATPYHISRQVLEVLQTRGMQVQVCSGVNLPMVIKALTDKHADCTELANSVRAGGLRGIVSSADDG